MPRDRLRSSLVMVGHRSSLITLGHRNSYVIAGELDDYYNQDNTLKDGRSDLSKTRSVSLILILACASFLNTVLSQACVIVLPVIGKALNVPAGRQQWIVSAAALSYSVTVITWGRIADVAGRGRIFLLGLVLVVLTSVITPFAPNEIAMDIFRALQGVGSAASTPTAIGIISATYPPGQTKIYAISAFSAGFPLGNVFGNILGGIIGEYLDWEWIFWIIAIFSAIITVIAWYVVPSDNASSKYEPEDKYVETGAVGEKLASKRAQAKAKVQNFWDGFRDFNAHMDWLGVILLTAGLVMLLVALTEGNVLGWSAGLVIALMIVGVALVGVFIWWQLFLEKRGGMPPVMKLSIFKNGTYTASQIISFFFQAAFDNFLVFATYFYQDYQQLSVVETTLRFLPSGVSGLFTVFISSQILMYVRGNYIITWSTICLSVACLLFAVPIPPSTSYWAYGFPAMVMLTLAGDTLSPCVALFVTKSVPAEDQAIGAAIFQSMQQLGRSVGLAVATAIQVAVTTAHSPPGTLTTNSTTGTTDKAALLDGYRAAEYFNVALGGVACLIAIFAFRGAGKVGAAD